MLIDNYLEMIAQGHYEGVRNYLNTGLNGRPISELNLSQRLKGKASMPGFLTHLFEALEGTQVKAIDLGFNQIDDEGVAAIGQALINNKNLKKLDLTNNQIGPDGASALAWALQSNKSLTEVDLAYNGIGPEGSIEIVNMLKKNNTLSRIGLRSNNIDTASAIEIIKASKISNTLTFLDLTWNNIDSEGVEAILREIGPNSNIEIITFHSYLIAFELADHVKAIIPYHKCEQAIRILLVDRLPQPIAEEILVHVCDYEDSILTKFFPNRGLHFREAQEKLKDKNAQNVRGSQQDECANNQLASSQYVAEFEDISLHYRNRTKRNLPQDNTTKRQRT